VSRARERRLARLIAGDAEAAVENVRGPAINRAFLRQQVWILTILRTYFPPEDAGPALVNALELWGAAEAELAAMPDTAALRAADEAVIAATEPEAARAAGRDAPESLLDMIGHIIEGYYTGRVPFSRTSASPMECLAWSLASAARRDAGSG
jgi:hypothetical protein